jgi:hypothetical protein
MNAPEGACPVLLEGDDADVLQRLHLSASCAAGARASGPVLASGK